MSSSIPRLIHQTWKTREVPAHLKEWHRSVVDQNPGWEVRVWSDADNRELIARHFPWFLPTYDGYPLGIMRVDAVRPFLLYHYGGVYADLDVECLRPFSDLWDSPDARLTARMPAAEVGVILGLEKRITRGPVCSNAVMASRAGHPLWPLVFHALEQRASRKRPWFMPRENYVLNTTGPEVIDEVLAEHPDKFDDVMVVRPELLCPLGWWQSHRPSRVVGSVAVHRYGSSWMGGPSVAWQSLLRWLN